MGRPNILLLKMLKITNPEYMRSVSLALVVGQGGFRKHHYSQFLFSIIFSLIYLAIMLFEIVLIVFSYTVFFQVSFFLQCGIMQHFSILGTTIVKIRENELVLLLLRYQYVTVLNFSFFSTRRKTLLDRYLYKVYQSRLAVHTLWSSEQHYHCFWHVLTWLIPLLQALGCSVVALIVLLVRVFFFSSSTTM